MAEIQHMTVNERQDAIIEEFDRMGNDQLQKYEYLVNLGRELPPVDEKYLTEDYLIKGCQSSVWLHTYMNDGKIYFEVESDSAITKGIAGLLVKVLSGHEPAEVAAADLYFIDRVGLQKHLSPTRSNGLQSMVEEMISSARSCIT